MMNGELRPLTLVQKKWINQTWPEGIDIKKFMIGKIMGVPGQAAMSEKFESEKVAGSKETTPLAVAQAGFIKPTRDMVEIKKGTLFVSAYIKIYDKFDFPT